jgi:hypothetical protein
MPCFRAVFMLIFLKKKIKLCFLILQLSFFGGVRGSNPKPCIYYASSLPTELSSQRLILQLSNIKREVLILILDRYVEVPIQNY